MADHRFRAMVSSDWSECLSPNGPFDPISFVYPELQPELERIFRQYTGNTITLRDAVMQIGKIMPSGLTPEQMDAYLDARFQTYRGVPELIEWCIEEGILFMINTTGTQGYFQRAIGKGLIPPVPVVAANPMIRFPGKGPDARYACDIHEIDDKPRCTAAVLERCELSPRALIVMGDSGGDGPHFRWAGRSGGFLIANMAKTSLVGYCHASGVTIDRFFGVTYSPGESRDSERELTYDFSELSTTISEVLASRQ